MNHAEFTEYIRNLRLYKRINYTDERLNNSIGSSSIGLFQLWYLDGKYDGVQILQPCITTRGVYNFGRLHDLLFGVYVPIDITHFRVYSYWPDKFVLNVNVDANASNLESKSIDDILMECKTLPVIKNDVSEDDINPHSECCEYIHETSPETLLINGILHKRVSVFNPCLPIVATQYCTIEFHFDRETTFYAELVTLNCEDRLKIGGQESTIHTDYSSDPVISVHNGGLHNNGERFTEAPSELTDECSHAQSKEQIRYTQECSFVCPSKGVPRR